MPRASEQISDPNTVFTNPANLGDTPRASSSTATDSTQNEVLNHITTEQIGQRVRSKSSISRSVPNFLDISKEQEIGTELIILVT